MEKGKHQDAYARKHNEDTQLPQILRGAKPAQGGEGWGGVAGGSFLHKPQQQAISKI